DVFAFNRSIGLILMTIIGGVNSLWGPAVGAVLFLGLEQVLSAYVPAAHLGIYGLLLILMMLFEPRGLWSLVAGAHQLPTPNSQLPTLNSQLPTSNSQLPTSNSQGSTPNSELPRPHSHLPILTRNAHGAETMLALHAVTKRYGGLTAVDDVTVTFGEGSITAIIGPNGAGKTTLFSMIAGAAAPTSGRVVFEGRDLTGCRPDAVCRAGIGRTFQVVKPFWQLTVRDHLRAAATFGKRGLANAAGRAVAARQVEEVLALTGLDRSAEARAITLTLADCRRLEIARALATGARLVLLDETMAGLTPEETRDAIELVKRVNGTGRTVILIEHVLSAVTGLATRAIVMDRGAVMADGPPRDVLSSAAVKRAYLGED
ncbi:MAG: ATP-binding cassette domain-containing protein, partial [Vicinamibacterales bacterium]